MKVMEFIVIAGAFFNIDGPGSWVVIAGAHICDVGSPQAFNSAFDGNLSCFLLFLTVF